MTIDKEKLISLLIDKTGLEAEQVESQLAKLISRIKKAAAEGKTFEIEGFGVFGMKEGNLQFHPSNTLETEINNKYAGMKPIELIGAFKEPEGDEVPEMPEEMPDKILEEGERWTFDLSAAEREEEIDGSLVESIGSAQDKQFTKQGKASREAKESFEKIFGPEQDKESVQKQNRKSSKPADPVSKDDGKDTLGRLLVAAVIVIAIGVSGWIVYDMGLLGNGESTKVSESSMPPSQVPAQQTADTQQEPVQGTSSQKSGDDKTSEPEQEMTVGKQEGSAQETEVQQQSRFGLQGVVNQSVDGYTIVVHSLRVRSIAENNRQMLENAGYRAMVSRAQVNGTTYYRVSIGQFQTVGDAQQATNELPARYRENNFIKRIK